MFTKPSRCHMRISSRHWNMFSFCISLLSPAFEALYFDFSMWENLPSVLSLSNHSNPQLESTDVVKNPSSFINQTSRNTDLPQSLTSVIDFRKSISRSKKREHPKGAERMSH